ncbi:MAG: B12-binding domain-containing radical SAM protein [Acidobacteria bacterium]|nr:B12-binding domain-containing radical SAM protein [Acidobacteriota bacterium]
MKKEKILLMLLPFWDPQIPPSGISCLKSYLQQYGYDVKTIDANIEDDLKGTYHKYFEKLKEIVPGGKQGNFNKIGFDIMHNHLMANLNRANIDENGYVDAIRSLFQTTFFIDVNPGCVFELDRFIVSFFQRLEAHILSILAREKPGVLGITVYTDTLAASLLAFKLAKQKYPGMRTVMGGGIFAGDLAMGTPNMEFFLEKTPFIDKILVGEGERLFLNYLEDELHKSSGLHKVATLSDIHNEIMDITTAGVPDFSDFDLAHYPYLTAYTSRSCPFQCEFCTETIQWGKYRKKSARQVTKELLTLYQRYGGQLFLMGDSLLNPIITDLAQEMEKEDISIYWDGYLRADRAAGDTENTMLWRRGGFYRARLGIESGSQRVLDLMNKKITTVEIKSAISALAYAGIKTTTYWVVGFPGETEADFQETLDLLEEMADDIYEADCSPFWYYLNAQGGDTLWKDKSIPLYSDRARDLFLIQTWIVDCEPNRAEIYRRMWRFTEHCKKLGIPNPYSLQEFHQADLRWLKLQKNAAPPMVWFGKKGKRISKHAQLQRV